MKKVLFVATVVKTHIMEFHIPYLKMFKEQGWETVVAAKNDYKNPDDCIIPYCDQYYNVPFERIPLNRNNLIALKILKKVIDENNYDIIHCHTPVGAMVARLAAIDARKKGTKLIYTAHGFHFYKSAPVLNWILYYPVEKLLSKHTDVLITINKEDYNLAKRKFAISKIEYVPGVGLDIKKFNENRTHTSNYRSKIGVDNDDIVLLSVGELIRRKNHKLVIDTLARMKENVSFKYVICGQGKMMDSLKKRVVKLKLQNQVLFLGYRNDIPEICGISDIFVFPSLQEGLPVALMEAMACGLPCIVTDIRGNRDLIQHKQNGILIKSNSKSLQEAISYLETNHNISKQLGVKAKEDIRKYDLNNIMHIMKRIYFEE